MSTSPEQRKRIIEAALMVAERPLSISELQKLFDEDEEITTKQIRDILEELTQDYQDNGVELCEIASGFRFQARTELSHWLSRLWEERAPRLSRALLETLALIAYRQPITRAEIEEIRGVVVSSNIIKTLQDREWIRIVGYKDSPGKPALLATTKTFLDHLTLKNLTDLPPLSEIVDLDKQEEKLQVQLELQTDHASPQEEDTTVAESPAIEYNESSYTFESEDDELFSDEELITEDSGKK